MELPRPRRPALTTARPAGLEARGALGEGRGGGRGRAYLRHRPPRSRAGRVPSAAPSSPGPARPRRQPQPGGRLSPPPPPPPPTHEASARPGKEGRGGPRGAASSSSRRRRPPEASLRFPPKVPQNKLPPLGGRARARAPHTAVGRWAGQSALAARAPAASVCPPSVGARPPADQRGVASHRRRPRRGSRRGFTRARPLQGDLPGPAPFAFPKTRFFFHTPSPSSPDRKEGKDRPGCCATRLRLRRFPWAGATGLVLKGKAAASCLRPPAPAWTAGPGFMGTQFGSSPRLEFSPSQVPLSLQGAQQVFYPSP